jgi:SAM-dependent methyltransferase
MSHLAPQLSRAGVNRQAELRGLPPRLCLALARAFTDGPLSRFGLRQRGPGDRFASQENYVADRVSNVEALHRLFSPFSTFAGKTVLELGCSSGYVLAEFLARESFHALGADIDPGALARGRSTYGDKITFVQSSSSSIPLPDASADVIYTVDTVEHLSRPRDILADCYRVLRPGGRLLVHFTPWLGPWGAHLEDIVPFPWPHVVFSMDTLLSVAAHLYDSDEYTPACYWFDPETGARRPNPYLDRQRWHEFLNHITIRQFIRVVRKLPFRQVHLRRLGFGGRAFGWTRALKGMAHVPLLDELFCNAIFCVLEKPR